MHSPAAAPRFDPETQRWGSLCEMYHPRSNFGIEVMDDMIFAMGGFNGMVTIAHTECYDAEQNTWLEASDMNIQRSALTTCVVHGLANVRDYTHKQRDRLMEERRQRIMQHVRRPSAGGAAGMNGSVSAPAIPDDVE